MNQFKRKIIRPRKQPIPGAMNKLEEDYANHLKLLQLSGKILEFKFEGIKLKLANRTFYTPDFVVVTDDAIELHEVKGFWEDDARVKIKVAAEQFYYFKFIAIQRPSKKQGFVFEYFNECKYKK